MTTTIRRPVKKLNDFLSKTMDNLHPAVKNQINFIEPFDSPRLLFKFFEPVLAAFGPGTAFLPIATKIGSFRHNLNNAIFSKKELEPYVQS